MEFHRVGSEESVLSNERAYCPRSCRRQALGCTNIPSSMECSPLPTYATIEGSERPGPNTCGSCNHVLEIILQSDGSNGEMGWWLLMTEAGTCGPSSGRPEMLESRKVSSQTRDVMRVPGICEGAIYQIGISFPGDLSSGAMCCTDGGSMIYLDGILLDASLEFDHIYTVRVPSDISTCPPLTTSECQSDCSITAPSVDQSEDGVSRYATAPNPTNNLRMSRASALESAIDSIFITSTSLIYQQKILSSLRETITALSSRYVDRGFTVCELVEVINSITRSQMNMSADVIRTSALSDGCQRPISAAETQPSMLGRRSDFSFRYDTTFYSNSTMTDSYVQGSSLTSKRTRLTLMDEHYSEIDETIFIDLFHLIDTNQDDKVKMNEIIDAFNIFSSMVTSESSKATSDRTETSIVAASRNAFADHTSFAREFLGIGVRNHIRPSSSILSCSLNAAEFRSRCYAQCSVEEPVTPPTPVNAPSPVRSLPRRPGGNGCFPEWSQILMSDGSQKVMKDLQYGDRVATVSPSYTSLNENSHVLKSSPIVTFSHFDREARDEAYIVSIHILPKALFNSNPKNNSNSFDDRILDSKHDIFTLQMTPNHMIPVFQGKSFRSVPARKIARGMELLVSMDELETGVVIKAEMNVSSNVRLFAPHTLPNNIVVNNVVVSCSTENMFLSSSTNFFMTSSEPAKDILMYFVLFPVHLFIGFTQEVSRQLSFM